MKWYYDEDHERVGPFGDREFHDLVRDGSITDATLVWNTDLAGWIPYREVSSSPRTREASATRTYDRPLSHAAEGVESAVPRGIVYAGFWIRFLAKIIDFAIIAVLRWIANALSFVVVALLGIMFGDSGFIVGIFGFVFGIVVIAVDAAYCTWFVGRLGATPGKMLLGLKIVRSDMSPLSYPRAFCRYLGEFLSFFILLIGYIIAAFDDEKRTLHDHICDTRVIDTRPKPSSTAAPAPL